MICKYKLSQITSFLHMHFYTNTITFKFAYNLHIIHCINIILGIIAIQPNTFEFVLIRLFITKILKRYNKIIENYL